MPFYDGMPDAIRFVKGEDRQGDPILEVHVNGLKKGTVEKRDGSGTLTDNLKNHYILKSMDGVKDGGHAAIDLRTQGEARAKATEFWSSQVEDARENEFEDDVKPIGNDDIADAVHSFKESQQRDGESIKKHQNNAINGIVSVSKPPASKASSSKGRGRRGMKY